MINKLIMFTVPVNDMPKAKTFYADWLGLKVASDYRQDDNRWWVSLTLPDGNVSITLTTYREHLKPGNMVVYFATSDLAAAHRTLNEQGIKVDDIKDDLYGPGSGVKWFTLKDPDGNVVYLAQQ